MIIRYTLLLSFIGFFCFAQGQKKRSHYEFSKRDSLRVKLFIDEDSYNHQRTLPDLSDTTIFGRDIHIGVYDITKVVIYGLYDFSYGRIDITLRANNVDTLLVKGFLKKINFYQVDYSTILIEDLECKIINIPDYSYKNLDVKGSQLNVLNLNNSVIQKGFNISHCTIDTLMLENTSLPKEIYLNDVNFKNGRSSIDFTHLSQDEDLIIHLKNTYTGDFIFNPRSVHFVVDTDQNYDSKIASYKAILKKIDRTIYPDEFGLYDAQYQEIKLLHNGHPIINWIEKKWWGYGYDNARVFGSSIFLFFIFICLNFLSFEFLRKVYCPEKIAIFLRNNNLKYHHKTFLNKSKYRIAKGLAIILYSSYIFWGLKLDIEKINLKYWFVILLIFFEYIVGLISLGYIAHYILAK